MNKRNTRLITFGGLTADVSEIRSCRVVNLEDVSLVHVEHGAHHSLESLRFDDAESAEATRAYFCKEWRGIVSPPAPSAVIRPRFERVVIPLVMFACALVGWAMYPITDILVSMREPVSNVTSTSGEPHGELGYSGLTGGTSR